jgi:hypothetical protein
MGLTRIIAWVVTALMAAGSVAPEEPAADSLPVDGFAALALACVHHEYPNKISHVLQSDEDVAPPRELTPAFYGCFDWHSSVHGHWLLVRLSRLYPNAEFVPAARAGLASSLTKTNLSAEAAYLAGEGRASFERPYGLAWLLCLAGELRSWDDDQARQWAANLAPLEAEAAQRFRTWLPKLDYAIRTGEHSQTAFAFGLVLDWARVVGDEEMTDLVKGMALEFFMD